MTGPRQWWRWLVYDSPWWLITPLMVVCGLSLVLLAMFGAMTIIVYLGGR